MSNPFYPVVIFTPPMTYLLSWYAWLCQNLQFPTFCMPPRPPLSSPVRHILVCAGKMIANKLTVCPTLVCMQWPHVVWCVDCRCWQIGWLVTMWYTCGPKLWYHSLFYTDIAHAWLHERLQHVNAMLQQNSYCGPHTHKNILNCRFNSVYSPYWGWCAPSGWWFERGCYYWYSHYEHQYFLTKHFSLPLSLSLSLSLSLHRDQISLPENQ